MQQHYKTGDVGIINDINIICSPKIQYNKLMQTELDLEDD